MKKVKISKYFYLDRSHVDKISPSFMTFATSLWKQLVKFELMDLEPIIYFEGNIFNKDKLEIIFRKTGERISFTYSSCNSEVKIDELLGDITSLSNKIARDVASLFIGIEEEFSLKKNFYMIGLVDFMTHKIQIKNTHIKEIGSKNKMY